MTNHIRSSFLMALAAFVLPLAVAANDPGNAEGYPNGASYVSVGGTLQSSIRGQHLGVSAPEATAGRRITLAPDTRYANVVRGETVTFVYRGKAFTWNFDTLGTPVFELAEIAPRDFGTGHVRIYVGEDNRYISG